jgi:flagellar biosynthesis protein FlhA
MIVWEAVSSVITDDPGNIFVWIKALTSTLEMARESGHAPVILCSEQARPLVRQTIKRELPDTAVLSITEIKDNIGLRCLGEVRIKTTG